MASFEAPASADPAAETLDVPTAQQILRSVIDPASTAAHDATQVDSTDPAIGQKLHGFAVGAGQGGYTPDKWTVKSIAATGATTATATVAVASPHAPAPVDVTYTFVRVGGTWKLTQHAADALLAMSGGPHGH
ncbi:DUF4878 domain-containing protein [Tsukamurella soli]